MAIDAVALVTGLLQIVLLQSAPGDSVTPRVGLVAALVDPLIDTPFRADRRWAVTVAPVTMRRISLLVAARPGLESRATSIGGAGTGTVEITGRAIDHLEARDRLVTVTRSWPGAAVVRILESHTISIGVRIGEGRHRLCVEVRTQILRTERLGSR